MGLRTEWSQWTSNFLEVVKRGIYGIFTILKQEIKLINYMRATY